MSQEPTHSVNRTLLESSLEIKCLFFFGLALTIVIAVSFYLYFSVTEDLIQSQNPRMAELLVGQDVVLKHMKLQPAGKTERTGVIEAPVETEIGKAQADYATSIDSVIETLRTENYKTSAIRSPDYKNIFAQDLPENYLPKNKYEEELLDYFRKTPGIEMTEEEKAKDYTDWTDSATDEYHYYRPIRVTSKDCTHTCHQNRNNDPLVGDLVAIIHVTIPKPPTRKDTERYWAMLLGVSIITAFLSLIAFYSVIRWVIIKPLRYLRDVAEGISRGDTSKRADLHTGDEFESLSAAFNRMLRHLMSAQEKLRGANNELEYKVDQLAHTTIQLHETNRMNRDFMATMSHELRTPLNSILGFSDVLGSIATLDDKQKRYVNNINTSGRKLLSMINDILDMAKIETGRMEVKLTNFQIEHIVAAQSDMAKPLLDKKNIDLEVHIEPHLPPIRQDESRIQQIVNNLLSNAIKFTPEGGRIRITVGREDALPIVQSQQLESGTASGIRLQMQPKTIQFLILQVSDTGVGISEEDQQIVFEKFRQAKSQMTGGDAMKREYSGSGLGLSIVKEICKMLDGDIRLESQLGVGSTFTVRLPWNLEPRLQTESEMMVEIQQFAKSGS